MRKSVPHVIVVDIGGTTTRVGVLTPAGELLREPTRFDTPTGRNLPGTPVPQLQERLVREVAARIRALRNAHIELELVEVGVSLGAVVTHEGMIENASMLWCESAKGADFRSMLESQMPDMRFTVINDVSAAAWRYHEEGRFCLITVSTGIGNKVFNDLVATPYKLELDDTGLGGEMGHIVVSPEKVNEAVTCAVVLCQRDTDTYARSALAALTGGDAMALTATALGRAAVQGDPLALDILAQADVPYCECGNLGDLCSYSSGPAVERLARQRARAHREAYDRSLLAKLTGADPKRIDSRAIAQAAQSGDPFALAILDRGTYFLALRILQLCADLGLNKVLITGGFAMGVGRPYFATLRKNLLRLVHRSGYFTGWTDDQICDLVKPCPGFRDDALIGIGFMVQERSCLYRAVTKPVGQRTVTLETRRRPRCGAEQFVAQILYAGVCSTDLQILRGERGFEPGVLGHECVAEVVAVGPGVAGLDVGGLIAINPNNPRDEDDKVGHSREGVFQDVFVGNRDLLDKQQVIPLPARPRPEWVLLEPLACVMHSQRRIAAALSERTVVVVGAGVLGLLHVLVAQARGAKRILLVNRSERKLRFAVQQGLVGVDDTLLMDDETADEIIRRTEGGRADVMIIALAGDGGLEATERLLPAAADGAIVNLFGGFLKNLTLRLDSGEEINCSEIRSRSLAVSALTAAGKRLVFAGSRGSEYEDYIAAVEWVTSRRLELGAIVTHVASLPALPRVLSEFRDHGTVNSDFAMRVVVDMALTDNRVEPISRVPLIELRRAASVGLDASRSTRHNRFTTLGFVGGHSQLGWVTAPSWPAVDVAFNEICRLPPMAKKKWFLFCGTGGWIHGAELVRELPGGKGNIRAIHSLDPAALTAVLESVESLEGLVCIGLSHSGSTLETRMLMDALREDFDAKGLDYRGHFLWLSTRHPGPEGEVSGTEQIRGHDASDWTQVEVHDLTVDGRGDVQALFGAPNTLAFLLPLMLSVPQDKVRQVYDLYLALRDEASGLAADRAHTVAQAGQCQLHFRTDAPHGSALERWTLQLTRQALSTKSADFQPTIFVGPNPLPGFTVVDLNFGLSRSELANAMLFMHACQVFAACLAYHHDLVFVTHREVARYKARTQELMEGSALTHSDFAALDVPALARSIRRWLSEAPGFRFVEVVLYRRTDVMERRRMEEYLTEALDGRPCWVFEGSDWNHHSYQAAVSNQDTLYVIVDPLAGRDSAMDASRTTFARNVQALKAIARATHQTLGIRSRFVSMDGTEDLCGSLVDEGGKLSATGAWRPSALPRA